MTNKAGAADEVDAMLFNWGALRFLIAGDDIFGKREPSMHPSQDPQYVLYAHALELSLKAFLRHVGVSTAELAGKRFGHDVGRLYDEAITRGLNPPAEYGRHFEAVTHLTTDSNQDQSLRYWTPGKTEAPRIEWLRAVAHLMMEHVAGRLSEGRAGGQTHHGRRASEMFGPEHYDLPKLPDPPLRTDGPALRRTDGQRGISLWPLVIVLAIGSVGAYFVWPNYVSMDTALGVVSVGALLRMIGAGLIVLIALWVGTMLSDWN